MPSSTSTSSIQAERKGELLQTFQPERRHFHPWRRVKHFCPAAACTRRCRYALHKELLHLSSSARPSLSATQQPASTTAASPTNPFFGNRVVKKASDVCRFGRLQSVQGHQGARCQVSRSYVAFSGKPYRQHFVVPTPGAVTTAPACLSPPTRDDAPVCILVLKRHIRCLSPSIKDKCPSRLRNRHVSTPGTGPGPGPAGPVPQQQPFGMVYQPLWCGPYQYPGGQPQPQGMPQGRQPSMVPPMQMAPGMQGAPMPYGAVPQQFMGQMPFSHALAPA